MEKKTFFHADRQNVHARLPFLVLISFLPFRSLLFRFTVVLTRWKRRIGCPQNIARKGHYGAFLMERDETLVCRILTQLRASLPSSVSVSAKIRLPLDPTTLSNRICRLLDTGIDFATIHARTLEENKTRVGPANLHQLRNAIGIAHQHIPGFPIVANGGMETFQDANRIVQETGAVAVMSSEALLERPDVFSVASTEPQSILSQRQTLERQLALARDYLLWCQFVPPLPGVLGPEFGTAAVVRGHLFKLLHQFFSVVDVHQHNADLRDRLASHAHFQTLHDAHRIVDELEARTAILSDAALEARAIGRPESSWYRRHWQHPASGAATIPAATTGDPTSERIGGPSPEQRKDEIRRRIRELQQQKLDKIGTAR